MSKDTEYSLKWCRKIHTQSKLEPMTLFQARYIQLLTLGGCSMRATAGNYYGRYHSDGSY